MAWIEPNTSPTADGPLYRQLSVATFRMLETAADKSKERLPRSTVAITRRRSAWR